MNIAKFSLCRLYRYTLWRKWIGGKGYAMVIGLNPSTADEVTDDPTVRRYQLRESLGLRRPVHDESFCLSRKEIELDASPKKVRTRARSERVH